MAGSMTTRPSSSAGSATAAASAVAIAWLLGGSRVSLVSLAPKSVTAPVAMDIAEQARKDGVRDLRQSGLIKVRAGVTSLEEVIAVTNE